MRVQKTENYNPAFGLGITPSMYKRASQYYNENMHDHQMFNRFYRKAKYIEKNFGHDDYRMLFSRKLTANAKHYTLCVLKLGQPEENAIVINSRRRFSELIECFIQLKPYYVDKMISKAEAK